MIGLWLYTGPTLNKYNTTLRGLATELTRRRWEDLCHGTMYVTTLHVINSDIVKLGKVMKSGRSIVASLAAYCRPSSGVPTGLRVRRGRACVREHYKRQECCHELRRQRQSWYDIRDRSVNGRPRNRSVVHITVPSRRRDMLRASDGSRGGVDVSGGLCACRAGALEYHRAGHQQEA